MRWAEHLGSMGERKGAHNILVVKHDSTRTLGRHSRRWKDNIKMDLSETG
jgi:hypothetical protein